MARTSDASRFRRRSGRVGAALAGVAMAVVLAGCAAPYVSEQPAEGTGTGGSLGHEVILVCESGTVTGAHGVETSSAVATRVPAGKPVPPGCRLG